MRRATQRDRRRRHVPSSNRCTRASPRKWPRLDRRRGRDNSEELMRVSVAARLLLAFTLITSGATSAFAQVDLTGSWLSRNHEDALERGGGPYAVDYTGVPLSDEGRARALAYSADQMSMIERQ